MVTAIGNKRWEKQFVRGHAEGKPVLKGTRGGTVVPHKFLLEPGTVGPEQSNGIVLQCQLHGGVRLFAFRLRQSEKANHRVANYSRIKLPNESEEFVQLLLALLAQSEGGHGHRSDVNGLLQAPVPIQPQNQLITLFNIDFRQNVHPGVRPICRQLQQIGTNQIQVRTIKVPVDKIQNQLTRMPNDGGPGEEEKNGRHDEPNR